MAPKEARAKVVGAKYLDSALHQHLRKCIISVAIKPKFQIGYFMKLGWLDAVQHHGQPLFQPHEAAGRSNEPPRRPTVSAYEPYV